jgi:hypothetical protein
MSRFPPTPAQVLLLRSALDDGDAARAAWDAWQGAHRLDDTRDESYWLLPLVFRNLRRLGVELDGRFAGLYKRSWFKNRRMLHRAARVIEAFTAAGIPTLVLKGAALSVLHYRDLGARVMEDVDLLVPPAQLGAAVAALAGLGFSPGPLNGPPLQLDDAWVALHHSFPFHDAEGREIDLHWYLSGDARQPGVDDPFWQAAVPVTIEGAPSHALAPTDLLFHVCAHGYTSNTPHLRWLADAATILRDHAIDWERVVAHARARRLVLALAAALFELRAALGAPVPEAVTAALGDEPVSLIDRLEFAHDESALPYTTAKVALRLWCWHRRGVGSGVAAARSFPTFLRRYFGVDGTRALARVALARGWQRRGRPHGR